MPSHRSRKRRIGAGSGSCSVLGAKGTYIVPRATTTYFVINTEGFYATPSATNNTSCPRIITNGDWSCSVPMQRRDTHARVRIHPQPGQSVHLCAIAVFIFLVVVLLLLLVGVDIYFYLWCRSLFRLIDGPVV